MNVLRPDEILSRQKQESNERTGNLLKSTARNIGGAAIGAGLTSRILPFLNDFVPVDLALKGISKISPKIGNFLKTGMEQGLDLKGGIDFIKERMGQKNQQANPQENRNIIEQYSDQLHEFLKKEIQGGADPLLAGARAQQKKEFDKIIKKMESESKTPFSAILQTVFGGSKNPTNQPQQQTNQIAQEIQQPQKIPIARTAEQAMYSSPAFQQQSGLPPQFQQAIDKIMSM